MDISSKSKEGPVGEHNRTEAVLISEVEREGHELLVLEGHMAKVNFSDSKKMRSILQELVKGEGTSFYGATIEEVTDDMTDVCRNMKATVKNTQGKETYHIWFARNNGKWILKFCQIPQA